MIGQQAFAIIKIESSQMYPKSKTWILAGAIAVLGIGLAFLFWFGLSDFICGSGHLLELSEEKPWRPVARALFSIVMSGLLIFFCGLTIKLAIRHEN